MLHATANVTIPSPARYMARLCNHFSHRVTVHREETQARIEFSNAPCSLQVLGDQLRIQIESTDAQTLVRLQEAVTRHLKQVASTETVEIIWSTEVTE